MLTMTSACGIRCLYKVLCIVCLCASRLKAEASRDVHTAGPSGLPPGVTRLLGSSSVGASPGRYVSDLAPLLDSVTAVILLPQEAGPSAGQPPPRHTTLWDVMTSRGYRHLRHSGASSVVKKARPQRVQIGTERQGAAGGGGITGDGAVERGQWKDRVRLSAAQPGQTERIGKTFSARRSRMLPRGAQPEAVTSTGRRRIRRILGKTPMTPQRPAVSHRRLRQIVRFMTRLMAETPSLNSSIPLPTPEAAVNGSAHPAPVAQRLVSTPSHSNSTTLTSPDVVLLDSPQNPSSAFLGGIHRLFPVPAQSLSTVTPHQLAFAAVKKSLPAGPQVYSLDENHKIPIAKRQTIGNVRRTSPPSVTLPAQKPPQITSYSPSQRLAPSHLPAKKFSQRAGYPSPVPPAPSVPPSVCYCADSQAATAAAAGISALFSLGVFTLASGALSGQLGLPGLSLQVSRSQARSQSRSQARSQARSQGRSLHSRAAGRSLRSGRGPPQPAGRSVSYHAAPTTGKYEANTAAVFGGFTCTYFCIGSRICNVPGLFDRFDRYWFISFAIIDVSSYNAAILHIFNDLWHADWKYGDFLIYLSGTVIYLLLMKCLYILNE